MKQYGPNGGVNRIKVTGKDFETMRVLIQSKPNQISVKVREGLRLIAAQGVRDMRETVKNSTTKTGLARAARGEGQAGRIVTGKMLNVIDQEIRTNKNRITMRFGWLNGRPGYSFFQEYGTSNGVPAMHALTDAKLKASIEVDQLLRNIK